MNFLIYHFLISNRAVFIIISVSFIITCIDLQTVVELTHSMIIYLAPLMSH